MLRGWGGVGVVVAGKGWEGWKGGRGGGGFGVGDGDEELGWRGWGWKVLWVERGKGKEGRRWLGL